MSSYSAKLRVIEKARSTKILSRPLSQPAKNRSSRSPLLTSPSPEVLFSRPPPLSCMYFSTSRGRKLPLKDYVKGREESTAELVTDF